MTQAAWRFGNPLEKEKLVPTGLDPMPLGKLVLAKRFPKSGLDSMVLSEHSDVKFSAGGRGRECKPQIPSDPLPNGRPLKK
ncbi:hypothetical protein VNO77_41466 [Canavalia gladiata]|uniref:Uncharacterized protein n=1 Tax=Canavalia gladiata TaxID=3824 RepID=A0AAN9K1Q9_CANGL